MLRTMPRVACATAAVAAAPPQRPVSTACERECVPAASLARLPMACGVRQQRLAVQRLACEASVRWRSNTCRRRHVTAIQPSSCLACHPCQPYRMSRPCVKVPQHGPSRAVQRCCFKLGPQRSSHTGGTMPCRIPHGARQPGSPLRQRQLHCCRPPAIRGSNTAGSHCMMSKGAKPFLNRSVRASSSALLAAHAFQSALRQHGGGQQGRAGQVGGAGATLACRGMRHGGGAGLLPLSQPCSRHSWAPNRIAQPPKCGGRGGTAHRSGTPASCASTSRPKLSGKRSP